MKLIMGVALVVVGLLFFLNYIGVFAPVNIVERTTGPFTVVYEEHIGDYAQTGVVQDKIYNSLLNEEKISTYKGFGLYYDNPKEVAKENLKSEVGCILEENDLDKVSQLQDKYQIKTLPEQNSIVIELPFKNKLSIIAGVFKVYPKVQAYMEEKGYQPVPSMEIYDVPKKRITYIFEIKK